MISIHLRFIVAIAIWNFSMAFFNAEAFATIRDCRGMYSSTGAAANLNKGGITSTLASHSPLEKLSIDLSRLKEISILFSHETNSMGLQYLFLPADLCIEVLRISALAHTDVAVLKEDYDQFTMAMKKNVYNDTPDQPGAVAYLAAKHLDKLPVDSVKIKEISRLFSGEPSSMSGVSSELPIQLSIEIYRISVMSKTSIAELKKDYDHFMSIMRNSVIPRPAQSVAGAIAYISARHWPHRTNRNN